MGNFIKRIYLTEKYDLRKQWDPSTQVRRAIIDPVTGNSLEYRDLIKNEKTRTTWNTSFANELGRLANGLKNRIKGTNIIKFIPKAKNLPSGKTVTYGRIVVDYRPQKSEQNRTRLTVGGNRIQYNGIVRTPTADLVTVKLLFNSILSTPRAKCSCIDIKTFT